MGRYIISEDGEKFSMSRAVLGAVALAGLVSVAILAPNALQMFRSFNIEKLLRKQKTRAVLKYHVNATIARLYKEGCVTLKTQRGETFISLTEKGGKRLRLYETGLAATRAREKWDGKWRVVIFDVAEDIRSARDKLRASLQNFGFVYLQRSVWVFPYECEDLISMLKTDQELWENVLYMVVEKIEGEERLRKQFRLSPTLNKK